MDSNVRGLVEQIHSSPTMGVLAVAGAGGQALAWLLGVPGASRTLIEAVVPYGAGSFTEFLGYEPAQYVSAESAEAMAGSAYCRALKLREGAAPIVGIGCTATIATDRPKRGEHRCYVAAQDVLGAKVYGLNLTKGSRDRAGEEDVVSRLVLWVLAESCRIGSDLPLGLLGNERLEVQHRSNLDLLEHLIAGASPKGPGQIRLVNVHRDGSMTAGGKIPKAVLAGSFHPLHHAHEELATVASEMLGVEVVFEISVTNVDKPPLEELEVRQRLGQFEGKWEVVLTRAPTFRDKAALFPGCTFIIGWDTAVRVVDPKYHGGTQESLGQVLSEILELGCRFLVAGRVKEGVFRTLADVPVPQRFRDLFDEIPEHRFRSDISSTELRTASG